MKRSPIVDGWPLVKGKAPLERLMANCRLTENGCWEWTSHPTTQGYGKFYAGRIERRSVHKLVHRVAYELLVGPIPEGLTLDHLCRNTLCFYPGHLEPVTIGENTLRGTGPIAANARKTHCDNGHEYTEANTYHYRKGKPGCRRCCRTCGRAAQRRYQERLGAK